MLRLEIGGEVFRLKTAAISCVRYRAAYGESVLTQLRAAESVSALEGVLVRLCHAMLPEASRPGLLDFAALCRRDGAFLTKALEAKNALLAPVPGRAAESGESGEDFDEYKALALVFAAGVDFRLVYELPILHLLAVVEECFSLRTGGGETEYRPMTQNEMRTLYPK